MKQVGSLIVAALLRVRKYAAVIIALAFLVITSAAKADYAICAVDSSGNVTFTPGVLTVVLIGAIVAAVTACAGIVLLWKGVRWLIRVIGGMK